MYTRIKKITKSLKFKLTLWYSLILSVFCIAFVFSINVWLTNYMNEWEPVTNGRGLVVNHLDRPRLRMLTEDQKELVMESRMADLENIRQTTIYMVIPMILLSLGGGYLIAKIMLRPLDSLNSEIKSLEASSLGKAIKFKDNGDEISQLIESFNRMSFRLGKNFKAQKAFVENASHELKTPLSVIQANLDVALDDDKLSKKEVLAMLKNSKKQVLLMDKLTEDLLLLSMMSAEVSIEMEDIEMGDVVEGVIDGLFDMAKKKDMDIVFKNTKDFVIKGNEVLMGRAVGNVIENSIKYSEGSVVEVEVNNGFVYITDDGKGIPKDKKKVVFERFGRLDKGRSRKEGGTGLGLAISREVVQLHRGKLELDTEYSNGARFVMEFSLS